MQKKIGKDVEKFARGEDEVTGMEQIQGSLEKSSQIFPPAATYARERNRSQRGVTDEKGENVSGREMLHDT